MSHHFNCYSVYRPPAGQAVDIESYNGYIEAFITGYLIPASQLPASPPAAKLPARLTLPTH